MEYIQSIFSQELIHAISWSLLHSIWQASLILIVFVGILRFIRNMSAQIKYLLGVFSMVLIFTWAIVTGVKTYRYEVDKQVLIESFIDNPTVVSQALISSIKEADKHQEATQGWNSFKLKTRLFLKRHSSHLFTLWLLGVCFFFVRLAGSSYYLHRLKYQKTFPAPNLWEKKARELALKLKLKKGYQIFQSALAKVPMVIGHFKPVILLPISLMSKMSPDELEAVIAHELAHIRRNDYGIQVLLAVIEALFFYNPAVWVIKKIISNERELCCDDIALSATDDRLNYIKALAQAQELALINASSQAVAFSDSRYSLLNRIKRIQKPNIMENRQTDKTIAILIVTLSLTLLSFTFHNNMNVKGDLLGQTEAPTKEVPASNSEKPEVSNVEAEPVKTPNVDSLRESIHEKVAAIEHPPVEVEQLLEIEQEMHMMDLSEDILLHLDSAFAAIDTDEILMQVDSSLKALDLNLSILESLELAKLDSLEPAEIQGIEIAKEILEDIDIDGIVSMALEQARIALEAVDMEKAMKEEMEALQEEMKELQKEDYSKAMEEAQIEIEEAQKQIEAAERELEAYRRSMMQERELLDAEQAEIKKQKEMESPSDNEDVKTSLEHEQTLEALEAKKDKKKKRKKK